MSNAIATIAVCAALLGMVASCSWGAVEQSRLSYEARQKCFDAGANWNSWVGVCERPANPN